MKNVPDLRHGKKCQAILRKFSNREKYESILIYAATGPSSAPSAEKALHKC